MERAFRIDLDDVRLLAARGESQASRRATTAQAGPHRATLRGEVQNREYLSEEARERAAVAGAGVEPGAN